MLTYKILHAHASLLIPAPISFPIMEDQDGKHEHAIKASPESVQWFRGNDMRENKEIKRAA